MNILGISDDAYEVLTYGVLSSDSPAEMHAIQRFMKYLADNGYKIVKEEK